MRDPSGHIAIYDPGEPPEFDNDVTGYVDVKIAQLEAKVAQLERYINALRQRIDDAESRS